MCKAIGDATAKTVRRLELPGCPPDAICHHLGVSAGTVHGAQIGISDRDGLLLVTIYQPAYDTRSATTHRRRARSVAEALGCAIKETWNGGDGHSGISVVLNRLAPRSLVRATDNYRRMRDVFKPMEAEEKSFAVFDAWFALAAELQNKAA